MSFYLITKAYAESDSGSSTFDSLLSKISTEILLPIIYLLFALSLVYFLWGVFVFVKNSDNPEKRSEGYDHMIWGIIGLFIMISANGIVNLITNTTSNTL